MTGTKFKAENGLLVTGSNSYFVTEVSMEANLTVSGDLLYVGGNLYVVGDLVYTDTKVSGDMVPDTDGANLGNTVNRFDAFFSNVDIDGYLLPSSNGISLGNSTSRWLTYSSNLNVSGATTLSGNLTVNTTALAVNASNKTVGINATPSSNTLTIGGNFYASGNGYIGNTVVSKSLTLDNAIIYTNTATVTTTSQTIIDRWPVSLGPTAKIIISVKAGTTVHSIEILTIQEGTNVLLTSYGEIYNTKLGTFDSSINGTNVELYFTATSVNTYTVKTVRTQII